MTDEEFASPDVVNASALDVISCGLGAAVLLFLVLSIVRVAPASNVQVDEFLAIHIQVSDAPDALVAPVVTPPGVADPIIFPIVAVDRDTGRLRGPTGNMSRAIREDIVALTQASPQYTVIGLSPRGETPLLDETKRIREFVLIVHNPRAGTWQISARYFAAEQGAPPPSSTKTIDVKVVANTLYAGDERIQKLSFGDQVSSFPITVRPRKNTPSL